MTAIAFDIPADIREITDGANEILRRAVYQQLATGGLER